MPDTPEQWEQLQLERAGVVRPAEMPYNEIYDAWNENLRDPKMHKPGESPGRAPGDIAQAGWPGEGTRGELRPGDIAATRSHIQNK